MSEFKEQELSDWGNSQGWNDFFTQFNEYLRSLAYSYKLPSQDVDDVVQEVFVSMASYFKENKFDSAKGKIHSWVTTFAKWRMVDIIRRNQRKNKQITSGDDLLMEMALHFFVRMPDFCDISTDVFAFCCNHNRLWGQK